MAYKVVVYTEDQEEVKKIMELAGLTPSPFPDMPVSIDLPNSRTLEISQVLAMTAYSGKVTYQELLDEAENDDERRHLQALISARGVKLTDKVDEAFWDVLLEEGHDISKP